MRKIRQVAIVILALFAYSAWSEDNIPKYLQVARDVVANVKPENNQYSNKPRYIRFPGDLFTSEYTVRTDCTGFVEAVLDKGNNITPHFSTRKFPNLYSIIDWVDGVDRGEMFDKFTNVAEVKAGDLIMWKYIIHPTGGDPTLNGHIAMFDSAPRKMETQHAPLYEGYTQWEVTVLDSNAGAISPDDTRYVANHSAADSDAMKLTKRSGAGRGRLYLYTNEAGEIVAMAAAFNKAKILVQDVNRHMIMARVRAK